LRRHRKRMSVDLQDCSTTVGFSTSSDQPSAGLI
jgi:hypothetical protein